MSTKKKCLNTLDKSIRTLEKIKFLVIRNNFKQAILEEANLLFFIGSTLNCINRFSFINGARRTNPPAFPPKTNPTSKKECIRLINRSITRLRIVRRLLIQNQSDRAANLLINFLTGRLLNCLAKHI